MRFMAASFWARLMAGLALVWALLQGLAAALHSLRGEAGLIVGAAVVAALLAAEWLLFRAPPGLAARSLGLGLPDRRTALRAAAIAGLMLLFFPAFAVATGIPLRLVPGWEVLAVGILAQGGLAEEALFRGYLFRRVRERHSFWRAAALSMIPFTAVHLLLFTTLPVPVAAASLLLAVVTSFPLARLFEQGARSVWPPALVHAAIQSIKLFEPPDRLDFALGWMLVCALVPLCIFRMDRRPVGP